LLSVDSKRIDMMDKILNIVSIQKLIDGPSGASPGKIKLLI